MVHIVTIKDLIETRLGTTEPGPEKDELREDLESLYIAFNPSVYKTELNFATDTFLRKVQMKKNPETYNAGGVFYLDIRKLKKANEFFSDKELPEHLKVPYSGTIGDQLGDAYIVLGAINLEYFFDERYRLHTAGDEFMGVIKSPIQYTEVTELVSKLNALAMDPEKFFWILSKIIPKNHEEITRRILDVESNTGYEFFTDEKRPLFRAVGLPYGTQFELNGKEISLQFWEASDICNNAMKTSEPELAISNALALKTLNQNELFQTELEDSNYLNIGTV